MDENHSDAVIIGSGPAGWTAAIYLARAGRKVTVVEGMQPGGQLTITTEVENYPGFEDPVMGPDLMSAMGAQARRAGAIVVTDMVTAINPTTGGFSIDLDGGPSITSKVAILATGAKARWLGVDGEEAYTGRGVSTCATCDGFFFRKKSVAVIGGGNTAFEEALYLSNIASKVTLVHRRSTFRAERVLVERAMAKDNIEMRLDSKVVRFEGDESGLTRIVLDTGALDVDGAFVAIGHDPVTELVKDLIKLDESGYVIVEKGTANTTVPGLFAAGDVCDPHYRQAVTSAGMGCIAALDADKFIEGIG